MFLIAKNRKVLLSPIVFFEDIADFQNRVVKSERYEYVCQVLDETMLVIAKGVVQKSEGAVSMMVCMMMGLAWGINDRTSLFPVLCL